MTLRRQLLLVSLLTLVLPWAGCEFVRETEQALRLDQHDRLKGVALAIVDSLSRNAAEFQISGDQYSDTQIYEFPLASAPVIDGYFDDWSIDAESLRQIQTPSGDITYAFGAYRTNVYFFIDVPDEQIVYANPGDFSDTDAVSLLIDDANGRSTMRFESEAPGPLTVRYMTGDQDAVDSRIAAQFRDTPDGYRIEARVPRQLIGSRIGVQVQDAGDTDTTVYSSFDGGRPGEFVQTSILLASTVRPYTDVFGVRVIVTNIAGWRLASAGTLDQVATADPYAGLDTWQRIVYRALLEQDDDAALVRLDPSGREQQDYVARALNGDEDARRWLRNGDTGRAVAAVAQPIWAGNVLLGALILQEDTAELLTLTNESLMRLITWTVLVTLIVALSLVAYATWLSYRVRRLSHAADHALDETKPTTGLPSADAVDEIGDLSRSFSSVLQQLGSYNEYLRTLASKLSHELRTPLTIVTSSLENLDHELTTEQAREYAARARDGADRLKNILNAMSEANRVEQLVENAEMERFDLSDLVKNACDGYAQAWPERSIQLRGINEPYPAAGSPELILQMLDKLMDNAVDFSKPDSLIDVDLMRSDGEYHLSVTNMGPPLPADMRHRLFESMVSVRRNSDGSNLGLGLNIAKLIAEGHGGRISGENIDGGVRFTVALPVS